MPESGAQVAVPPSVAWANSFAEAAPAMRTPLPGPNSLALMKRRDKHEFGTLPWVDLLPIGFNEGAGVTLTDVDGNRYIDLTHGHMAAALGHGNPEVCEAISEQSSKLMNLRNYPNEMRMRLMERLAEITPGDLNMIGFYSSGTEAAEASMRAARAITGGHEFVSFYGDYHGKTAGAMATGLGSPSTGPRMSGCFTVPAGYCHRCEFKLEPSTCGMHCVDFLDSAIKANSTGAMAGIIVEPITNGSGARVYPPGYLKGLRDVADRHNIPLIFDEHATGLGRTGTWWAGDHEGVIPDMIFFAKFLGNGYPITCLAVSEKYRHQIDVTSQSSTHGGQPAACAAALACLDIIQRDNLVDHVAKAGVACLAMLKGIAERHRIVGVAQGRGYLLGLEFVDPKTGLPSADVAWEVAKETIRAGVCVSPVGPTMRVSPMLVTSEAVALRTFSIVETAIAKVESRLD